MRVMCLIFSFSLILQSPRAAGYFLYIIINAAIAEYFTMGDDFATFSLSLYLRYYLIYFCHITKSSCQPFAPLASLLYSMHQNTGIGKIPQAVGFACISIDKAAFDDVLFLARHITFCLFVYKNLSSSQVDGPLIAGFTAHAAIEHISPFIFRYIFAPPYLIGCTCFGATITPFVQKARQAGRKALMANVN